MSRLASTQPELTNFLTFDIEEWYHANYEGLNQAPFSEKPTRFPYLVNRLIEICAESGFSSTFFVLGSIADRYPEVVRGITAAGHEVASHGFDHRRISRMTPREFKEDLVRSCRTLEDVTGQKVHGFRAPSFSVTTEVLPWFYDSLAECGLQYSSSVFAGKTFLYGIPGFPDHVHFPRFPDGRQTCILEFPIPGLRLAGTTIGVYMRLFPAWFLRMLMRRRNARGDSLILYVHPREIDPEQHRLPLPTATRIIHYWGVNGCERKLEKIARDTRARFGTLIQACERFGRPQPERRSDQIAV